MPIPASELMDVLAQRYLQLIIMLEISARPVVDPMHVIVCRIMQQAILAWQHVISAQS